MLSFIVAALAAVLVGAVFKLTVIHSIWGVIPPALIAFTVATALLLRRAAQRLEPLVKQAEKHMLGGRRELALKSLRDGLGFGRWHPLLPGQLRVQIGILEYAAGNLDAAEEELAKGSRFPWLGKAYLGIIRFKKRDTEKMKDAFEVALKSGDKEGILYTLYAHCLIAQGKREDAVKVLERGLKKIEPKNEAAKVERGRLETNLELAKEGKKLKTAPYGDAWNRFGLDGTAPTPTVAGPGGREVPKFARGFNPRPGFRQKPQRRK